MVLKIWKKVAVYVAVPLAWILFLCVCNIGNDDNVLVVLAENAVNTDGGESDVGNLTNQGGQNIPDQGTSQTESGSNTVAISSAAPVYVWVPTTPDEIERAGYGTGGLLSYGAGPNIRIFCELQGPECVNTMKAVMKEGYKIAHTYSIFYMDDSRPGVTVYQTDELHEITMNVPGIYKEGRQYEMICVSEDATTYTIPVEVDENNNVKFTTNHFYAYALVYKD